MATTQISNVIVPEQFAKYVLAETAEKSALVQSGIIKQDESLNALIAGGGKTITLPTWKDLAGDANVSGDDPTATVTTDAMNTNKEVATVLRRNGAWEASDLVASLAGSDPIKVGAKRVSDWWLRQEQKALISTLNGIFADNTANDRGDMVIDVAEKSSSASVTTDTRFNTKSFIDALVTLGDGLSDIVAIAVHSAVYAQMLKNDKIAFVKPSEGSGQIATFLDRRVIVDDSCPTETAGNGKPVVYTSYLFGEGSIVRADGMPKHPTSIERNEKAGNGGGLETLISRREMVLHPRGMKFTDSSVAGQSPTNAELAMASNWDRVWDRKQIKLAALKTN